MPLYTVKKNQRVRLLSMPDDQQLTQIGLRQGMTLTVISRHPLGGPIVVRIEQRDIAIDKILACAIDVELSV